MSERLITAAELMARRPGFVDVPVEAWDGAVVRIRRLDGPAKLRASLAAEELDSNDKAAMYEFGADLLAQSIVDEHGERQFADPAAKAWLCGEVGAVSELIQQAIIINGLAAQTIREEVDRAKKNSANQQQTDSPTDLHSPQDAR